MAKDQVLFLSVLSFLAGIAWGSFFSLPSWGIFFLFLAGVLMLCVVFLWQRMLPGLLFVGLGWGGAFLASTERTYFEQLPEFERSLGGIVRIVSDPEAKDFFQEIRIRFEHCETTVCPEERILWQAPLSFSGQAGDRLSFSCVLERPKNFSEEFDYRMFLAKDGVGYVCKDAEASLLERDFLGGIMAGLYVPKHRVEEALSHILAEPEAGLAKGLLLGGGHYLPRSLKDSFASVGLSHMIAVSGYNITILAEIFLALGLFFGLWRYQALWVALIGIVFFIVMIGMPASAARAGAMASIAFLALQSGRLAQPLSALLFALGIMLLFQPLLFRYDIGFQLSFLATLGILCSAPYQEKLSSMNRIMRSIAEVLLMTLAVELFVLPIILFSFHTFSPLIFVGNFLVLLVPFAMAFSFGAVILFFLFPGAHMLLVFLAYGLLACITHAVEWLGMIPWAHFTFEGFGVFQLVGWYVTLGFLVVFLQKKFLERV